MTPTEANQRLQRSPIELDGDTRTAATLLQVEIRKALASLAAASRSLKDREARELFAEVSARIHAELRQFDATLR